MSHRAPGPAVTGRSRLLSASVLMAVGTILSRLTGFVRNALILVALGQSLDADLFTQANTIPNSLYILVAGGVFNVVLVPQLVRAMRNDPDGGHAYAGRVLALGLLVLTTATVLLVVAVPLIARLLFPADLFTTSFTEQRESAYALMRYCMPQVFFYGVFVLLGQMLNARERFGPMMWAPITNNLVACGILVGYLLAYGGSDAADGFSRDQELLLGLGSTLGVLVQTLVLVPYLRAAGIRLRPRFDLRGTGLGHTLRLGLWTFGFVVLNQIAFFAISRIAVASSTRAASEGTEAAGATVYQSAFLIVQVPHAVITVSLVTATMPLLSRLSADGDRAAMRAEVVRTLRLVLTAMVPLAVVLAALGPQLVVVLYGYGEADPAVIGHTVQAFAPGMVLFTLHYLLLRGFYADEDTRTPFLIQLLLAATNIGTAFALTQGAPTQWVAPLLAGAYGLAYLIGVGFSSTLLSRRIGHRVVDRAVVGFAVRLLVSAGLAGASMWAVAWVLQDRVAPAVAPLPALLLCAVAGLTGLLVFVASAWAVRLREVRSLLGALAGRR